MNNKLVIWCMVVLSLLSLSAMNAHAVVTTSDVTLGSQSQEASNPEDDDGPRAVSDTTSLTFTSDSTNPVTVTFKNFVGSTPFKLDQTLSFSNLPAIENKLESDPNLLVFDLDSNTITLDSTNPSGSFQLESLIPASLSAVDNNFEESSFQLGSAFFDITEAGIPTTTVEVKIFGQRENQLEINDIDVKRSDAGTENIDNNDEVDKLEPGESLDFEVVVENNFDKDSNLELQDVRLRLECSPDEDIDVDDDDQNLGDISEGDDTRESFVLDIDETAKDDSIDCELSVEGRDANDALHGEIITFTLNVERDSHDIRIKSAIASPQAVTCDDSSIQLSLDLVNLGQSNEDRIRVEVFSKSLGIQEVPLSNLELDEDDQTSETISVPISPRTVKAGTYIIQIQTFYDNTKNSDTENVQIENTCELFGEGNGQNGNGEPAAREVTLALDQDALTVMETKSASVAVTLTNNKDTGDSYTISLDNVEDFAEPASSKTVFLSPGQTSTVFLNLKAKADSTGVYSGAVIVKDASGQTLGTQIFTVDVTEATKTSSGLGGLNFNMEGSKVFWIIGDVILVIVAIFFLRLIFTGGKRKQKKMADFEPMAITPQKKH